MYWLISGEIRNEKSDRVADSLVQYLTPAELDALLATWRGLLASDGFLILADVIGPI
jgi:hypothetical protein